jgi:hypothetical protein
MTMYLSVTPHVEPTHTTWTADPREGGRKERPRYGTWKQKEDQAADGEVPVRALVDRHVAVVRALADIARSSAAAQERHSAALDRALAENDSESARRAIDTLWQDLYPLLRAASELSDAWNALAPAAAPARRSG